ncbi:MAG: type II secretion system F family protein [Coriobacteriia bacterium]|nr:type II secretion system F family protein [Coriobacteriia bacterium]
MSNTFSILACVFAVVLAATAVTFLAFAFLEGKYTTELRKRRRASLSAKPGAPSRRWLQLPDSGLIGKLARLLPKSKKNGARQAYQRELPQLLELTAMGMRAGLGFDQAFELYTTRFHGQLASLCQAQLSLWEKGLISREEGLKALAEEVGTPSFMRFTTITIRGLRYGASINQLLLELAQEQRRNYRAEREEEVSKAPVKMLIPTGVFILPAMLLLVMGPIMLDMMGKL